MSIWCFKKKLFFSISSKRLRILMKPKDSICSIKSEPCFDFTCSIRILNIWEVNEKPKFFFWKIVRCWTLGWVCEKRVKYNHIKIIIRVSWRCWAWRWSRCGFTSWTSRCPTDTTFSSACLRPCDLVFCRCSYCEDCLRLGDPIFKL